MIPGVISSRVALHSGVIKVGENMQIFVDADACPVVGIVDVYKRQPLWNGTIAFLIEAVIQLHRLVKNCFI